MKCTSCATNLSEIMSNCPNCNELNKNYIHLTKRTSTLNKGDKKLRQQIDHLFNDQYEAQYFIDYRYKPFQASLKPTMKDKFVSLIDKVCGFFERWAQKYKDQQVQKYMKRYLNDYAWNIPNIQKHNDFLEALEVGDKEKLDKLTNGSFSKYLKENKIVSSQQLLNFLEKDLKTNGLKSVNLHMAYLLQEKAKKYEYFKLEEMATGEVKVVGVAKAQVLEKYASEIAKTDIYKHLNINPAIAEQENKVFDLTATLKNAQEVQQKLKEQAQLAEKQVQKDIVEQKAEEAEKEIKEKQIKLIF